jgi:uncharacterized protein YqgV (UPF0045/DUF77 family)
MAILAQISLYPLRQQQLSPSIEAALSAFQAEGLEVTPGPMSSIVAGEDEQVFAALKDAFQRASAESEVVMVVTLSNACPLPPRT